MAALAVKAFPGKSPAEPTSPAHLSTNIELFYFLGYDGHELEILGTVTSAVEANP